MDVITLEAQPRETGTKAARAVRREGNVPCVLYGHHVEPVAFQEPELTLRPLVYTDELHQVQVALNGDAWHCIIKSVDFHPIEDQPIHVDFQVLKAGEKVTVTVPIQYRGTPIGQKDGGIPRTVLTEVEVACLPKDIPSHIEVDISHLAIGDTIHIGDLDMPQFEFHASPGQTVATVTPPRSIVLPEEEEEESGAEESGADASAETSGGGPRPAEEDDEAAIFGEDFFKVQEPPPTRPRYTMPVLDDEDDDGEGEGAGKSSRGRSRKSGAAAGGAAGRAGSSGAPAADENAASIAGSLLSKTGKKNRPADVEEKDDDDEGYDFSEIKYLLLNRILPAATAGIVIFGIFYWLFGILMDIEAPLPQLVDVHGQVTQDGEPVPAKLFFTPMRIGGKGGGSGSAGEADASGEYEAYYKPEVEGVIPGAVEVVIFHQGEKTVRQIQVEPGSHVHNFELSEESGGSGSGSDADSAESGASAESGSGG